MLPIGAFARLAGVTVRTVRFYSERGLLEPAAVDADTGYRRYQPDQLERVRHIQSLQQLGFSLREIVELLERPDLLPGRLDALRRRLTLERAAVQRRLDAVDAWTATVDPSAITVRRRPAFHALGVRDRLRRYDEIDHLFREVLRRAPREEVRGGRLARWHVSASGEVEGEALVVVDPSCVGAVRFAPEVVASTTYDGDAWEAPFARLTSWMSERRCVLAGPKVEAYRADGRTEVQFPIERVQRPAGRSGTRVRR